MNDTWNACFIGNVWNLGDLFFFEKNVMFFYDCDRRLTWRCEMKVYLVDTRVLSFLSELKNVNY